MLGRRDPPPSPRGGRERSDGVAADGTSADGTSADGTSAGGTSADGDLGRIGPYRLERRLGSGPGFSEIYRAYDRRLDRRVVLRKIGGPRGERSESRRRRLERIKASSRLTHPAIVQVHDILQWPGAAGDELAGDYIVMELAEGPTLAELVARGPLPWPRALAYAVDIAAALGAAHDEGLAHGDLGGDKVMVAAGGRPKVTGFAPPAGEAEIATATPGDVRADIRALGALLYEMLAGDPPSRRDPPPPGRYRPLPAAVDSVVLDLLGVGRAIGGAAGPAADAATPDLAELGARAVEARLRQVLFELTGEDDIQALASVDGDYEPVHPWRGRVWGALAGAAVAIALLALIWWRPWQARPPVLAVAPFETVGAPAADDFDPQEFNDRLATAIAGRLERLDAVELRPIADGGASYVIRASVQWWRDRVMVRPILLRPDGSELWRENFYRPVGDLDRLRREVAEGVATRVRQHLGLADPERGLREAEQYREQGRVAIAEADGAPDFERALFLLRRATELEPNVAEHHAAYAEGLMAARRAGFLLAPSSLRLASRAMSRALDLGAGSALVGLAAGSVLAARGEHGAALETLAAARDAAPPELEAEIDRRLAWVHARSGELEAARRLAARASAGSGAPTPDRVDELAGLESFLGDAAAAARRVAEALALAPRHPRLVRAAVRLHRQRHGSPAKALLKLEELSAGVPIEGRNAAFAADLALAAGRPAAALVYLESAPALDYQPGVLRVREHLRARALAALGRPSSAALDVARRVLEAEAATSGDPRAMTALAALYAELGEGRRARLAIDRARVEAAGDALERGAVEAELRGIEQRIAAPGDRRSRPSPS